MKTNEPLRHGEKYENNNNKIIKEKSALFNLHLILALYSHGKKDNKTV